MPLTLSDLFALLRRRRKFLIIPLIITTSLCVTGAFLISPKYESSTTLLVQREEATNPLIRFALEQTHPAALWRPEEDRFKTFNDIIYSHQTLTSLIDSLGLLHPLSLESEREAMIASIRKNISTAKRGPETFSISYLDRYSLRAQKATSLLADLFIRTCQGLYNQRNELAVDFFQRKLDDLKSKFERSQAEHSRDLNRRLSEVPEDERVIYNKMELVDRQISEVDLRIRSLHHLRAILKGFPEAFGTEHGKQGLFELERADLPFSSELHTLRLRYDDYMQRYTPKYPEIDRVKAQILDLLGKMDGAVEVEIVEQQRQRSTLMSDRGQLVQGIKRSSIVDRGDQERESDYTIYRQLYEEMKIKLEQAKTARELGRKDVNQFLIIDPALVPTKPAKPNRPVLIGGGLAVGLLLGIFASLIAEILDATVRTTRDVAVYQKPIIAFLPQDIKRLEE